MMPTTYSMRVYRGTSYFTYLDLVDDFVSLSYTKKKNAPGYMTATFNAENGIFDTLQLDDEILLYRSNLSPAILLYDLYEYAGIFRGTTQRLTEQGEEITIHCPDLHYVLQKTIIAHKAGQADVTTWTTKRVDKIIENLIGTNFPLPSSTPPILASRLIPATTKAFAVAPTAYGSFINYSASYKSILEVIQELIAIDDLDVRVGNNTGFYELALAPILGTDRSTTVFFWLERGNMVQPVLDKRREDEPTQALVGGQGEGTARATALRTSANYANPTNHSEMFVDARHLNNTTAMDALGDSKLAERVYRPNLTFQAQQTDKCYYGQHYRHGDHITAIYGGEQVIKQIVGVTVNIDANGESVQLELEDV